MLHLVPQFSLNVICVSFLIHRPQKYEQKKKKKKKEEEEEKNLLIILFKSE
jgi:preprotein translocase subunit YajC